MKLLLIFAAILAFSLAEEKKPEALEDSQAEASVNVELLKEGVDLNTAASTYNSYVPPSQRPSRWNAPNSVPAQNWQPPKPIQPAQVGVPVGVQSDYYQHWSTPVYHPPTTTTPVSVLKDERYYGENGHYRFEYKIADGTWVGEEGYYTDPRQTEESLVKKGWYSYLGADKKTYTVSWWADHTGYHAYGDHLPTPPPAYQAAIEADKYKPQYDEVPSQTPAPVHYPTQTPAPVHYPTQTPAPVHYPTRPPVYQPTYTPEPIYYPTKAPVAPPVYNPPQLPTYQQPQYPQYPPQQHYPVPHHNYYSQQSTNNV